MVLLKPFGVAGLARCFLKGIISNIFIKRQQRLSGSGASSPAFTLGCEFHERLHYAGQQSKPPESRERTALDFLADLTARPWSPASRQDLQPAGLFIGKGPSAIEVVVATAVSIPPSGALIDAWTQRRARRAAPVLLVILAPGETALCGPTGDQPPVYTNVDRGLAERLCREILNLPDRHAAIRYLSQSLPSLKTPIPGLANEGLLALNELRHGTPGRVDWSEAGKQAQRVVGRTDRELLSALGFRIDPIDNLTSLLRSGDRRTALAVLLRETESPEAGTARFNYLSPVSYALATADQENLRWVVMVQGSRLRLYSNSVDAGVGRRGRTETFIECQPTLLADDQLSYLWLLFSAEALSPHGSLTDILRDSHRFAGDLAERLRERIYDVVVPELARGIAAARNLRDPGPEELHQTYQMALIVLFRLLFIAYAEDRDLLPYRFNDAYRRRSLKQKALELTDRVARHSPIDDVTAALWSETMLLSEAVEKGNRSWSVPAYNGGLFSTDPAVSLAGAALAEITLPDRIFETALRALLVIETADGAPGPVDFRSLGVREFGTIYEGLLESELAVAESPLAVDSNGSYRPAREADAVIVETGAIYLHNRSGQRKSSGSYYTKAFAVEHLLCNALQPALEDHFARLDALDEMAAARQFFDFRVADISMGSGHFLIAAIDRIEKAMADHLTRRPLPGVQKELSELRAAAHRALGDLADATMIEDGPLLRRMIARRCIYGVDLNMLSVQLARLSIWIHSFVPGLPLSVLDHSLVHGNALTGVGTVDEIRHKLEDHAGGLPLFALDVESLLGAAKKPLNRLGNLNDATISDVARAREAIHEAREAVEDTAAFCDIIAATPISDNNHVIGFNYQTWHSPEEQGTKRRAIEVARKDLEGLHPLHFPVAFPEVFLRERQGFDVIIGNPPWDKAKLEEHAFWARYTPGLRGLKPREREAKQAHLKATRSDLVALYRFERSIMDRVRKALLGGSFTGIGKGDPDLYLAFCWRFWELTAKAGGRIGVVLPRSALSGQPSADFRKAVFVKAASIDVTMLLNNQKWVFPEVHPQYTIGLVALAHGSPEGPSIRLSGPYASHAQYKANFGKEPAAFQAEEVLSWNDSASLPLLPTQDSVAVFARLRRSPRLDLDAPGQWRARPDREMDATNQKPLMDLVSEDCPDGYWPVYKGESFNLWTPDTGKYYAWADPKPALQWLQKKRLRAGKGKRSAHSEFPRSHLEDESTLACHQPRIAFRDIARATDQRTVIACLLPPKVFVSHIAPYFLWPRGDERDEAYLLGAVCSIPFDWYARRFIELHATFFVFNPFPIPRPERDDDRWQRTVAVAGRLACPDERFAAWAEAVGVGCGPLAADEKEDMIHELDAVIAHLYGLDEHQLIHIFETFHVGWNYTERLNGVLRHFRDWSRR